MSDLNFRKFWSTDDLFLSNCRQGNEDKMTDEKKQGINRRGFLKLAGSTAAAAAITGLPSLNPAKAAALRARRQSARRQLIVSLNDTSNSNAKRTAEQALKAEYEARNPHIEVIFEPAGASATTSYATWLSTQMVASSASDIRPDIVTGVYAPSRFYIDLMPFLNETNPYSDNVWRQDVDVDTYRATDPRGRTYMIGSRYARSFWYYNKELFAQAGIDTSPEVWTQPTWSTFVDACEKLEAIGVTPLGMRHVVHAGQWFAAAGFEQYNFVDAVGIWRAQPGDWNYDPSIDGTFEVDPDALYPHNNYTRSVQRFLRGVRDGNLRYDTPQMAELVTNWKQAWPRYATEDYFILDNPYPYFLQGNVAMIPGGTWMLPGLFADMEEMTPERLTALGITDSSKVRGFEWGTFAYPTMESPLVQSRIRASESTFGDDFSIIDKDPDQVDQAIDFMRFWFSKEGYQLFIDATRDIEGVSSQGQPAIRGVQDLPQFTAMWDQAPPAIGNSTTDPNFFLNFGVSRSNAGPQYMQDAFALLYSALRDEITPQEFAAQFQSSFETNFDAIVEFAGLTQADIDNPQRQPAL
jgi:raffinose/stachyose/melibiose transport system substrate-binding protein